MASSNRHWPNMFKSKPTHQYRWQHDAVNPSLVPNGYSTATTSSGLEDEMTPEPKRRWIPRPEQIGILEAIFNSGMVNPSREEVRMITAQLQEYGQVVDANVFYWFQNRKSRSKHKHRRLQYSNKTQFSPPPPHDVCNLNSPTASSVNQTSFFPNPEVFPVNNPAASSSNGPVASADFSTTQGFYFSELANVVHGNNSPDLHHTGLLLSEIMNNNGMASPMSTHFQVIGGEAGAAIMGAGGAAAISTVFINDVAFEVAEGPFNVREAFGDDAVLIHSSGHPVLTNEWGVTLHSLHHGAFYYLVHLGDMDQWKLA
ncbi:PREDICTED: WUSCHEL-related homeobox 9-like [Fragaria vesca subsp. vesca]